MGIFSRRSIVKAAAALPLASQLPKAHISSNESIGLAQGFSHLGNAQAFQGPALQNPEVYKGPHVSYEQIMDWLPTQPAYIAELRADIEFQITPQSVHVIDADLCAMRSLSQAARIYYMRQRLIERTLASRLTSDHYSSKVSKRWEKWTTIARKTLS